MRLLLKPLCQRFHGFAEFFFGDFGAEIQQKLAHIVITLFHALADKGQVFLHLLFFIVQQRASQHLHLQIQEGQALGNTVVQPLRQKVALLQYRQQTVFAHQPDMVKRDAELVAQCIEQIFGQRIGRTFFRHFLEIQRHQAQFRVLIANGEHAQIMEAGTLANGGKRFAVRMFFMKTDGLPFAILRSLPAQTIVKPLAGFFCLQHFGQADMGNQIHAAALVVDEADATGLRGEVGHDLGEEVGGGFGNALALRQLVQHFIHRGQFAVFMD